VDPGVDALWKEVPGGFTLLFKGISLVDLGAPLGAEGAWSKKFTSEIQGRKDARLAQVDFKETLDGLLVTGKWRFEAGDRAPAHPKMERFDFRDPETPAYVVDFWPKPGPTVAEVRESTRKIQETEHLKKSAEEAFRRRDRRIASEKARFEVEDSAPYCERPMDESRDVFLKFHPVRESFDLTTWFATTAPDRNYSYLQPKAPDKDAQYVRLALKLYKKSNFGLVIRTLDFLEKDFPASSYIPEMKFLRANALIKLGADDMAAQVFEQIVRAYSDAPVAMNAMIYLTHRLMKRGQHLAALENFLWLLDKYSVHRLSWVFHLGAAESLLSLRETDRAANEFKWVMANAPDRMAQAEAAARIGDLALIREQYDQALSSYFQSMQAYKVEIVKFPSIHINRAESLYWLGQYDQAKQEYERFLQLFANHPAGWRATYRLGEIASRSGTGANSPDARKWFYQTVNQFPSTPGAVLARIRLIPCGDRGGFSEAGAKRFYQTDAKTFNPINEIMMGRYRDFRGLGEMRMQVSMGRPDLALDVGLAELQANPLSEGKGVIGDTLHALLRKSIFKLLNDGKKYEALVFYTEHKDRMPKVKVEGASSKRLSRS
jgi:TolA-binding protein